MIRPPGLWTPKSLHSYNPIPRGCVLYLPLWALKVSGNGKFNSVDAYYHTCTQIGALWRPNGRWFDGDDDNMLVGSTIDSVLTTNDFTVSGWFKFDSSYSALETLIGKGASSAATDYGFSIIRSGEDEISIYFNDTQELARLIKAFSTSTLLNTWRFFTGTFDRDGSATAYVDASSIDTLVISTRPQTLGTRPFRIGSEHSGAALYLSGYVGEVWVHNRALSAGEIAHIYNCTRWRY